MRMFFCIEALAALLMSLTAVADIGVDWGGGRYGVVYQESGDGDPVSLLGRASPEVSRHCPGAKAILQSPVSTYARNLRILQGAA